MNWDQVAGQWKQFEGKIRAMWGKLTDDDLKVVAGRKEAFVGRIQERYGIAKTDAEKQLDQWLAKLGPSEKQERRPPM